MRVVSGILLTVALAVAHAASDPAAPPSVTQVAAPAAAANVIVVTLDGLRWQESFGGAERGLFGKDPDKDDPPNGRGLR